MPKKCKITIKDNANCIVHGLSPNHLNYFYEEYTEFAPGHRFNPKFKLGVWDGKLRFFAKTGKSYVNLLPDMVPRIIGLGYKINLIDNRPPAIKVNVPHITEDFFSHIINPDTNEPWVIRDYQVGMVNDMIDAGGGIGIAGTGAGKTSISAALMLSYELSNNLRTIIIVPDKNLNSQTFEDYQFFGLDVGTYSGDKKDVDHQHVVSTWQALQHNPSIIQMFDVVLVDECHGARGKVISDLLNVHGANIPFRFGVTGTLPKEPAEAMTVKIALGEVICNIPAHELISKGFLAKLHIESIQTQSDLTAEYQKYCDDYDTIKPLEQKLGYVEFKNTYFPDWTTEKHFFQHEKIRLQWMADHITMKSKSGNVFCLTVGVAFGKRLAKLIPNAIYLYGNDPVEDRKKVFALFKDHDNLIVIANAKIASTGLNIKRIFHLVLIDIGKSFITTIQGIGRGLRKAVDKDSVLITDISCDLFFSKRHMRERLLYYKEAKYPYSKLVVDYR